MTLEQKPRRLRAIVFATQFLGPARVSVFLLVVSLCAPAIHAETPASCIEAAVGTYTDDQEERRQSIVADLRSRFADCGGNAYFMYTLGYHLIASGHSKEAWELANSTRFETEDSEAYRQLLLGEVLVAERQFDEAIRIGDSLTQRWPEWHDGYHLLISAYDAMHDQGAARVAVSYRYESVINDKYSGAFFRSTDDQRFLGLVGGTIGISILALLMGLFAFIRQRNIENTPTSRIQSAAQGYVAVEGRVFPIAGTPLTTPHSGVPCVWYQYSHVTHQPDRSTRTIEELKSADPFLLRDETGECEVRAETAEIDGTRGKTTREGDDEYTERYLAPGDHALVLGQFSTDHSYAKPRHIMSKPGDGRHFLVSGHGKRKQTLLLKISGWTSRPVFVIALLVAAWMLYQRYYISCCPGVY